MCDVDHGEAAAVWNETRPRARTAHTCDECGLPILPGTVYLRIAMLSDGAWLHYAAHAECNALHQRIAFNVCEQDLYYPPPVESLRERVREHRGEAGILAAWRDILRARRAEGTWPARRAA